MSESFTFGDILDEALKGRQQTDANGNVIQPPKVHGNFRWRAIYAAGDKLTAKGDPKITIKWEVVGGPREGESMWQTLAITAKSKAVFGRQILGLGFTPEYLTGLAQSGDFATGLLQLADDIIGIEVQMDVQPDGDFDKFDVKEVYVAPGAALDLPTAFVTTVPQVMYPVSQDPNTQAQVAAIAALHEATPVAVASGFLPQV